MSLRQHLSPDGVMILQGTDKRAVLEEMVDALAAPARGVDREQIDQAIWRREGLMSTGIGHGLAVPHVRLPGLAEPVMVAAVCPAGVADYESMDAEPVRIIIMIAAPQGQHETYIRMLAEVAEVLKDPRVRRQILAATDPRRVYELVTGQAVAEESAS